MSNPQFDPRINIPWYVKTLISNTHSP